MQTVGVTNANIVLTAPAGTVTPNPGPTQAQNKVLRFTGTMTGSVRITLPLPGEYIVENLTTGAFVLSFQGVTATEVIGVDQGMRQSVYNDGANVRLANLGSVGKMEFWAGVSAIPAWVSACTVAPYLLCDGTVYNYSAFPFLGPKLAGQFGGNGTTTFGVPDLRGRVPLAYDGTGARITTAGSGINGQTLGAAGGAQNDVLTQAQLPAVSPTFTGTPGTVTVTSDPSVAYGLNSSSTPGGGFGLNGVSGNNSRTSTGTFTPAGTIAALGSGTAHPIVQPSQVAGVWMVKT